MEFKKITTGNGNSADLAATTNNRLELMVDEAEKLTSAIGKLEGTIVGLDTKNGRLQNRVFWLTVVGVVLAAFQLVQVVQIIIGWLPKST